MARKREEGRTNWVSAPRSLGKAVEMNPPSTKRSSQ
jgi:hypothetical protein